jgi:carbonic anhydrase
MSKFDAYAFSKQPGFDEAATRRVFKQAVPLRTVVVHCYDPRAAGIPAAVARAFDGEVHPGRIIADAHGRKVASTTTIFPVVVAGGRAVDALRSITIAQHLFGIERVVVVHHTHCGGTTFTADGIIAAYAREQHADIADLYPRESICIRDFVESLQQDTALVRRWPGTPKGIDVFGFVYDVDRDALELVVEDRAGGSQGRAPAGHESGRRG